MRYLLFILLLASLAGCERQTLVEHSETIAGINHTLLIYDADETRSQKALDAVFSELRLLSGFTHPTQSKPISRTNVLLRSREWFSVNPSLTRILKQSIDYSVKTDGVFNPVALGALRQKWGFYAGQNKPTIAKEQELQAFLAHLPTMNDIEFDGIRLQGRNELIQLDFDFLAYGNAIDVEIQHLAELGIENAWLRIGPVERMIGHVPADVFSKEMTHRTSSGQSFCSREIPVDTALPDARLYHDVIDTRSGHPIDHARAITVFANNARDASVACWAILVSKPESRARMGRRLGISEAVVTDASGQQHRYDGK